MDDFLNKPYPERPIVLSPPPVESRQGFPENFVSQRNQSVGYNLQQEFEALKADLDLDLSHNDSMDKPAERPASGDASGNSTGNSSEAPMLGGSRVMPGFASNSSYNLSQDSLMRDSLLGGKGLVPPLSGPSGPNRPQSVNDFVMGSQFRQQSSNFYSDMMAYSSWMEKLSPQELMAMLDYWCNSLPFDVLLTVSSRLQSHLGQGQNQVPLFKPNVYQDNLEDMPDLAGDMENLSVESMPGLAQPKPKANHFKSHLFEKVPRPKSADPTLQARLKAERARSPTSHLYEKTNFLQLAAASHSPHSYSKPVEDMDISATSKLGALATINSRVALDANRKPYFQGQMMNMNSNSSNNSMNTLNNSNSNINGSGLNSNLNSSVNSGLNSTAQPFAGSALSPPGFSPYRGAALYEESLNRQGNSSSVPVNQKYKKKDDSPGRAKVSAPPTPVSGNSSMPSEIASVDLLTNIPAWLKLLRLHKYTDCLKDMYWKDLVELNDEELEDKGVKALGARRKLLKAFDAVKQANP